MVAAWQSSGLGLYRFAMANRISPKTLRAWLAEQSAPSPFLPVRIVEPPRAPSLVVQLAGAGHRVEVPADFDAALLQRVVAALC